jgi:hypothetical protein
MAGLWVQARGVVLLGLSVLVGVFVFGPSTAATATVYTRSVSCGGLNFYPTDSRTEYDNAGPLRVRRTTGFPATGTGVFRCDPGLPNAAKVTKVQFTVELDDGGVDRCELVRSGLTTSSATVAQGMAQVTFDVNGDGTVRSTDSTINNATIDNTKYGYWLDCIVSTPHEWGVDFALNGIYGADVIYTITASNG